MPKQSDSEPTATGEVVRGKGEIRERVAFESARRARLAVPAFAGGVLYLLGSITSASTLKGLPTVGVLQGLAPALEGKPNPAVSPRAAEIRFYDHHSSGLIAGALLGAIALVILLFVLLFLYENARFRRPQTAPVTRWFVLVGGIGLPLLTLVGGIVQALDAHSFVSGHDFTTHAVESALTKNGLYEVLGYVTPLCALAFVGGMIAVMVPTVRVGLQPRWLGIVGGAAAFILLIPSEQLSLITAFWMVATGILLMGRMPGGDPPAWAAGEARPWPSQATVRAERAQQRGRGRGRDTVPEPLAPVPNGEGQKRRRRKRGK
ncbi:MAG TPA: hypothetical protein VMU32_08215 [Solirubrobacteraceae bacterium]|nr:hypothetical protein [Solirubrobacteraceae bacterium]